MKILDLRRKYVQNLKQGHNLVKIRSSQWFGAWVSHEVGHSFYFYKAGNKKQK